MSLLYYAVQFIFITWVTLNFFTSTSEVNIDNTNKYSEKKSLNNFLDDICTNLKNNAKEIGLEPLKLPDLVESFNQSFWLIGTLVEVYYLSNGSLYNLETIHRYGDSSISFDDNTLGMQLEVEVDNIKIQYSLDASFNGHGLWGTLHGELKLLRIRLAVNMEPKSWNITLQDISFPNPGTLDLSIDTSKILGWLINSVLKIVTTLYESTIISHIKEALKKAIEDYLKHLSPKFIK